MVIEQHMGGHLVQRHVEVWGLCHTCVTCLWSCVMMVSAVLLTAAVTYCAWPQHRPALLLAAVAVEAACCQHLLHWGLRGAGDCGCHAENKGLEPAASAQWMLLQRCLGSVSPAAASVQPVLHRITDRSSDSYLVPYTILRTAGTLRP